jgi:hypothetical protein
VLGAVMRARDPAAVTRELAEAFAGGRGRAPGFAGGATGLGGQGWTAGVAGGGA